MPLLPPPWAGAWLGSLGISCPHFHYSYLGAIWGKGGGLPTLGSPCKAPISYWGVFISPQPHGRSGQLGSGALGDWPGIAPQQWRYRGELVPGVRGGSASSIHGMQGGRTGGQARKAGTQPLGCPKLALSPSALLHPQSLQTLFQPLPSPHLKLCPCPAGSPTGWIQPCRKTAPCWVLMGHVRSPLPCPLMGRKEFQLLNGQLGRVVTLGGYEHSFVLPQMHCECTLASLGCTSVFVCTWVPLGVFISVNH